MLTTLPKATQNLHSDFIHLPTGTFSKVIKSPKQSSKQITPKDHEVMLPIVK